MLTRPASVSAVVLGIFPLPFFTARLPIPLIYSPIWVYVSFTEVKIL